MRIQLGQSGLFLSTALLMSCVPGETGIDRTSIHGEIHVPAVFSDEGDDNANRQRRDATVIAPLTYAVTVVSGELYASVNDGGVPGDGADNDWLAISSEYGFEADFELRLPGAENSAATYFELYDSSIEPEDPENPVAGYDLVEERLIRGRKARLQWTVEPNVTYYVRLGGVSGADNQPYNLVLKGLDPNDAGVLVGVFPNNDPLARGNPLGGTTAQTFELGPNWTWVSEYDVLFVRRTDSETCDLKDEDADGEVDEGLTCGDFIRDGELCDGLDNDEDGDVDEGFEDLDTDEDGEPLCGTLTAPRGVTEVDERVSNGFLFAGDWNSLNDGLPAGTWYTETALAVTMPAEEVVQTVEVATPLLLDAFAPLVIGWEVDEVEPNDTVADSNVPSLDIANGTFQDLGMLSGPGFVDIISGGIVYEGNPDTWDADVDGYKFQVTEPTSLLFTLDWAESVDLDILIMDADEEVLGLGYFNQPEVNEYPDEVYQPGQDYYIGVMIWTSGDDPGTSYDYTLALEQLAG
ncbi:MAG: hypothetical protein KC912_08025 [Proteobacteria bacterium]|nr:hypothetical protein [Pseudomonadota bacterium]